jgi:hypothetical protein
MHVATPTQPTMLIIGPRLSFVGSGPETGGGAGVGSGTELAGMADKRRVCSWRTGIAWWRKSSQDYNEARLII